MDYPASAFRSDGKGGPRACQLRLNPSKLLVLLDGENPVQWDYADLSLDHAGENGERLLITSRSNSPRVGSLTLADPAFRQALAGKLRGTPRQFLLEFDERHQTHKTRMWRNLVLGALGSLALFFGGYWAVNHSIAAWAAKKLPVSTEIKWGDMLIGSEMATRKEITQGPAYEASQTILERLRTALPSDCPYPFHLHLVEDPMVNAFALPGGHILLMTGLVKEAGSPEEVAGVLSHEMSHVLKRHVVKRVVQSLGWRVWFSLFFGSDDLGRLAFGLGKLMEISYTRDQETEADEEGAKLMAQAGLPVEPLGSFFDRLSKKDATDKIPAFISDHPASKKRSEDMRKLAETLKPVNPRPLGIDWQTVQGSLKP